MEPEVMDHLAHLLVVRLESDGAHMRRRQQNVGPIDRSARILGGSAALVAGGVLLHADAGLTMALLASVVLILLGVGGVISGARGSCPMYHRLGWSTLQARRKADQWRAGARGHR